MKRKAYLVTVSLLAISAANAAAQFRTFTDSSTFFSAIGNSWTTNFASLATNGNDLAPVSNGITLNGNEFSYQISGPGTEPLYVIPPNIFAGPGLQAGLNTPPGLVFTNFTLSNNPTVYGIGGNWFLSEVDGFFVDRAITVIATYGAGNAYTNTYTPTDVGSAFFGIILTNGDSLQSFVVRGDTGSPYAVPTAANVTVVPEPSTYALLGLAAAGLAGYVMRRRRK